MAIPISYNVRNLRLRKGLTLMTALGIALTVATAVFLMSLISGLNRAFASTGDDHNVVVLRKGSDAELTGGFPLDTLQTLRSLAGVARDAKGQPLASGELVTIIVLPRSDGTGEVNVTVRGTKAIGIALRPNIKLVEGRWFQPGQREVVVSKSIHARFGQSHVGDTMHFGKGSWTVVGVFDSGGSAYDSEIWGDVNQMAADFDRTDGVSSAYLRAEDTGTAAALAKQVSDDQRLKLDGVVETEYYAKQTRSGDTIERVGIVVGIIMGIGSLFAAMNMMYATVAYRAREIATLRILGFSRPSILVSFVLESMLVSFLGAVCGIVLMLPFNGLQTGTSNQVTFSEVVFSLRITPAVAMAAILIGVGIGFAGGLLPAWRAARLEILAALRG
jgi:putative ABC transport system permease protein